ncbi:hypothetical protein [Streptomyces sp. NPDC003247]|uniref:hypothetical protein n=1 Tax=Streptomyces sp. NPDC003247 TaxID=3364677 RepID=UPI0036BCA657
MRSLLLNGTVAGGMCAAFGSLLLLVPSPVDLSRARGVSGHRAGGVPQGGRRARGRRGDGAHPFAPSRPLHVALAVVAFGVHAVALPLHYVTTAEVVPADRRRAVFGVVAATGTLPGLFVPYLAGRLIDGPSGETAGYTAVFPLTALVMAASACGLYAAPAVRPEADAARLGTAAVKDEAQTGESKPVAQ